MIRPNRLSEMHLHPRELAYGLACSISLLLLGAILALSTGCANLITGEPAVTPKNPGETTVLAAGVIEKAVQAQRILLRRGLISSNTAQTVLDQARIAKTTWEAAQQALAIGDLDTALAKLQAAQAALDFLNAWLARPSTIEGTHG